MKTKTIGTASRTITNSYTSDNTKKIIIQIMYFLGSIIISKASLFGTYSPFGVAIAAAAPFGTILASSLGAAVGYIFLPTSSGSIRYLAAIIAVCAIRWTLNEFGKLQRHPLFSPIVAFLPIMATGFAGMVSNGFTPQKIIESSVEALMTAVGAYFIVRTIVIVTGTQNIKTLNQQEIACIVMTSYIFILSLVNVDIGTLSVGRILSVLIIYFASNYGGAGGGSIAGISAGIIFSLNGSSFGYIAGAYGFGGLMAGLLSPMGRIAVIISFTLCSCTTALAFGDGTTVMICLYECIISGIIFMLIPKNIGKQVSAIFAPPSDKTKAEGLRKSVIMRLDFAAQALSEVSTSVENVSQRLMEISTPDINAVYDKAINDTCKRCGLKVFCWERQEDKTKNSFASITDKLKINGGVIKEDFPATFVKRCCKIEEMTNAVNKYYDEYTAWEAAERRVSEVRSVVASQFCGLGDILEEISKEFKEFESFDFEAAEQINALLKVSGIIPVETSCRTDRFGRMSVEIETASTDRRVLKKAQLMKEISKICGRVFDTPCVTATSNRCRITLSERPCYDVQIASSQHISKGNQLCGDHFRYFTDGMGRMTVVISDGMGTGGRAAVDGSMAAGIMSRLAKAGLGFECALKIVNSAIMVKSSEESFATLDVCCIDLYTGEIEIYKAGAPVTFIKSNGKLHKADIASLPAGILPNITFSTYTQKLGDDDLIVMVSDGALSTGEDWICSTIKNWHNGTIQDLADFITDETVSRRNDGRDDDITVIVMRLMSG